MAQILSNFYLLAGRYNKEKQQVDCNDQGALFSTAQVDVDLSLTLRSHVDPQQLNQLLPVDLAAVDGPTHPILAVQINRFLCGGLAIAACVSHRVVDTASFSLFFTAWATTAHTTGKLLIQPYFDHRSSYFPAENLPPHDDGPHENIITERYIFDNKAIKKLCQRLTSFLVIAAEDTAADAEGENFLALASRIRHATVQGVRDCARVLRDKEFGQKLLVDNFLNANKKAKTDDCKMIWLADFSKFGDYELDFGFGKSDWISLPTPTMVLELKDHIMMLNNISNDGIEAWVFLQESDMQFFRQDKEILLLSASNLSVFSRI
ncbi:hypothetical protein SASPL_133894 [Salvia splendens]|uniref:Uncharacterized protein n=1 Tax=Salvia splendens TaxID=180675 RepID=A0A8X8X544_SALSN|nr:hypothetical protein SASPL_133894 [Salvia splendens]